MREGAAEFWAVAMFGGSGSSSDERIPYSEGELRKLFDPGSKVEIVVI